jgi:hypothetical protein
MEPVRFHPIVSINRLDYGPQMSINTYAFRELVTGDGVRSVEK